jgi:hypothetical protein
MLGRPRLAMYDAVQMIVSDFSSSRFAAPPSHRIHTLRKMIVCGSRLVFLSRRGVAKSLSGFSFVSESVRIMVLRRRESLIAVNNLIAYTVCSQPCSALQCRDVNSPK